MTTILGMNPMTLEGAACVAFVVLLVARVWLAFSRKHRMPGKRRAGLKDRARR